MIFCICLRERDDRLHESAREFHRLGLCSRILYYRPLRPDKQLVKSLGLKSPGAYGCFESHRMLARVARQELKCDNMLVFEDDVQFVPDVTSETIQNVARKFHNLPSDWDLFFLGHWPLASGLNIDMEKPQTDHAHRAFCVMAHAYS